MKNNPGVCKPYIYIYTTPPQAMKDLIRGALARIAVGGFAAAVVEANKIAAQALWQFNCLAAETAWVMVKAPWDKRVEHRERQQRVVAAQTENENNSEPNES